MSVVRDSSLVVPADGFSWFRRLFDWEFLSAFISLIAVIIGCAARGAMPSPKRRAESDEEEWEDAGCRGDGRKDAAGSVVAEPLKELPREEGEDGAEERSDEERRCKGAGSVGGALLGFDKVARQDD